MDGRIIMTDTTGAGHGGKNELDAGIVGISQSEFG